MAETAKKRQFQVTIEDANGNDYTFGGDDAAQVNIILSTFYSGGITPVKGISFHDPNIGSDGNGGTRFISFKCICTYYTHDHTSEDVDLPECKELCCLNQ